MDLATDADECNGQIEVAALNLELPDHEIVEEQESTPPRQPFAKAAAVSWILREIEDAPNKELRTSLRELGKMFAWGKSSVDTFLRSDLCAIFAVERGSHSIGIKLRPEAGQQPGQTVETRVVPDNPPYNPFKRHVDDFSWNEAESEGIVVQPHCSRTAVYWNPAGDIVIRAEQAWNDDEDPYIVLSPLHVPAVIKKLFDMIDRPDALLEELTNHVPGVGRSRPNRV